MAIRVEVPETEPATEYLFGELVQKVSPKLRHAVLQAAIAEYLRVWSRTGGEPGFVGTEWRFRLTGRSGKDHGTTCIVVPDVAYLARSTAAKLSGEALEVPTAPPQLVVEIISPDDRLDQVVRKAEFYRNAGVQTALVVDPERRTLTSWVAGGTIVHDEVFDDSSFPGLRIDREALFAELND